MISQMRSEKLKDLTKVRRRKITIRKKVFTKDEWGNQVETMSTWRALWAERSNLWGSEYYAASAINQEDTIIFVVRSVSFLNELNTVDFDIEFDGKIYDLKQIDHLKDDGMWVKLKCLERGADG